MSSGSSFCWGPVLQGSTSPSSTWSSAPEQAGQDQREARRPPPPPRPAHAPATPPAPHTDPAPSRRLAPPTRRLVRLASTSPLFALCAQELNLALLPRPGSRAARRGGAAAAGRPVRAGRALGRPGGARGWGRLAARPQSAPGPRSKKRNNRNDVLLLFADALAVAVCCLCHVRRYQAVFRLSGSSFVMFKNYHTTPYWGVAPATPRTNLRCVSLLRRSTVRPSSPSSVRLSLVQLVLRYPGH